MIKKTQIRNAKLHDIVIYYNAVAKNIMRLSSCNKRFVRQVFAGILDSKASKSFSRTEIFSASAAAFLHQTNFADDHGFIHCFAHVIQRQRRNAGSG